MSGVERSAVSAVDERVGPVTGCTSHDRYNYISRPQRACLVPNRLPKTLLFALAGLQTSTPASGSNAVTVEVLACPIGPTTMRASLICVGTVSPRSFRDSVVVTESFQS